jgi:Glycosyltransferase like family 2
MSVVAWTLGAVAGVLLLPTVSDLLSLLRVGLGYRPLPPICPPQPPRLLFLVPAHDEELLIESCVRSLTRLRYPRHRFSVVVVADNCADRTAVRARAAGAQCLERHDEKRPGKPRAIAWALARVPWADFDAVIIIDADTVVDSTFGRALAAAGPVRGKAVQAYFDVRNPADSALTRMAVVLAAGSYRFAYALKRRAGLNAPLLGNGMCIGTDVLLRYGWSAFTMAEDWELYALYTTEGVPIESLESARLYAQEARSLRQSTSQRQRWTAGKLTVLARRLGALCASARIGPAAKLDALAELTSPGPVVHLGSVIVLSALVAVLHPPEAGLLLIASWASVVRPALYAVGGLSVQPHPLRAATAFAFLPCYLVWRLGVAVASLKMVGDKPWVRTARS